MINVALPKGRLGESVYAMFETAGYECPAIKENNRKLIFENEAAGVRYDNVPSQQTAFHHAKPVYEEMPSWGCDISDCRTYEELPDEARAYVERLEELAGVRISIVTVGPERNQTIMRGWE